MSSILYEVSKSDVSKIILNKKHVKNRFFQTLGKGLTYYSILMSFHMAGFTGFKIGRMKVNKLGLVLPRSHFSDNILRPGEQEQSCTLLLTHGQKDQCVLHKHSSESINYTPIFNPAMRIHATQWIRDVLHQKSNFIGDDVHELIITVFTVKRTRLGLNFGILEM